MITEEQLDQLEAHHKKVTPSAIDLGFSKIHGIVEAAISTCREHLNSHGLNPAMVQARNDQLNEENEKLKKLVAELTKQILDAQPHLAEAGKIVTDLIEQNERLKTSLAQAMQDARASERSRDPSRLQIAMPSHCGRLESSRKSRNTFREGF